MKKNKRSISDKEKQGMRLLLMREILDKGEVLNKKELAEKYNVNEKTIQRDIDFLRNFYADNVNSESEIIYDIREKGYIFKSRNCNNFTSEEILAISKILLESRAFCTEELRELLRKLMFQVKRNCQKQVETIIRNEEFNYVPLKHNKKLMKVIWELSQYIIKQEIISIDYTTKEGISKTHRIKPLSIMFSEYYFYIISFMADKFIEDGPTIFRIDRIKNIKGTDEKFEIPYRDRFEDGEFRKRVQFMLSGKLHKVNFEYTGILEIVEDRLPTAKILKTEKTENGMEKYTISVEVYGEGIYMWLKSQGNKVKILEK